MKTLYLLRHAKAESGSKILSDKDRPLSLRGQQACVIIGEYIVNKRYQPELVLCSTSARTRETLARVMETAKAQWASEFVERLYLAESEEILRCVQQVTAPANHLLVIGHNPGMHHLALSLARAEHSRLRDTLELKYPTGTLTVLQFAISAWSELALGSGTLIDFATPSEL